MKKFILLSSLLACGALCLQDVSSGHGGTYRGPGDTVPPGGGGPGGGGGGGTTPGPSGPSGPNGPGGTTPGPTGPNGPGKGSPTGPNTGGGASGVDLTQWQFWWGFNQDAYLNLKQHIHARKTISGSDDFFLGLRQKDSSSNTLAPSQDKIRDEIVPALLEALRTETNNDIVTGALIALAKIGDAADETGASEFEQVIAQFLGDPSQEIAETAAIALGILGNPKSVPLLTSLVMDDDSARKLVGDESGVNMSTRTFAVYGLGQIGHRWESSDGRQSIVDLLWHLCEAPRSSTRDLKVAAVIALGLVPLDEIKLEPGVARSKETKDAKARSPRTRQEQVEYLLDFFQTENDDDKHELVRAHAPRSIVRLMEGLGEGEFKLQVAKALAPYVTKRGHIGTKEMRESASLAFGMLGDLDMDEADVLIRERLQEAVGNTDVMVKHFSVIALGQVGGRPGTGPEALAAAEPMRKFLMQQLTRGKSSVEPWAGLAIGIMERGFIDHELEPDKESLFALRNTLAKERSSSNAGAFAIACGIAGDLESESILLDKFENLAGDEVRGHIAIALGLMGATGSKEAIQKTVAESKYRGELLKQAAIALGLMEDVELVDNLLAMLAEAKTLTTQAAIASALGFIGDTRSVTPLIEMLNKKDITDRARGFAAVALGIVADKEALPWNSKFSQDINYLANTSTLTNPEGTGLLDIL